MSEFLTYLQLGFHHIANPDAWDHILFLVALAAVYRPREWRDGLWVVTAFTVGHSLTLMLAVTGAVALPTPWIEFLIPATIVVTCGENFLAASQGWRRPRIYRAALAGGFGLIHGAGFANYLHGLFVDRIAIPLFGFNLGIELGQVLILLAAGVGFSVLDVALKTWRSGPVAPVRLRTVMVSIIVAMLASRMMLERVPW